jgi:hypothetical protein
LLRIPISIPSLPTGNFDNFVTVFYESPSLGKFLSKNLILCLRMLLTIQCLLDPEMEALKILREYVWEHLKCKPLLWFRMTLLVNFQHFLETFLRTLPVPSYFLLVFERISRTVIGTWENFFKLRIHQCSSVLRAKRAEIFKCNVVKLKHLFLSW